MTGARSAPTEYGPRRGSIDLTGIFPRTINLRQVGIGLALLALFVAFMVSVQFSTPNLAGNDGYYHIKIASLMRTEGLRLEFQWLPLTILNVQDFVDHHFLYHFLLIPFTLGDLVVGAKWASVLFASLAFLCVWWLLHRQKVRGAPLWALGMLIVSEAFIFRMNMPRVQSLSLAFLVLALHWTLIGKHRLLLPLAFLYVWLYDAFPLILLVTAAFAVAHWLLEGRLELRPLVYASVGIVLGLLFHPYFPENLNFLARHILPKLMDPTSVSVGSEWFPYKTTQLVENSGLALAAFMGGTMALGLHARRMNVPTATALILSIAFGFMLFQSRRFIEYFPAFVLIFAALAWSPIVRRWIDRKDDPETNRQQAPEGSRPWKGRVLAGLIGAIVLSGLYLNLEASRESMEGSKPYQLYGEASAWLRENTSAGALVFQTDWDDFPRLFFFNSHNTYTIGLDPTYMQLHDPDLYELWVDLTQGRTDDLSDGIQRVFGAQYVITDLKHSGFLEAAEQDTEMKDVYRDEFAAIFEIETE